MPGSSEWERQEFFELYGIAVEMADRVSARRALANAFFLSIQTAFIAAFGIFVGVTGEISLVEAVLVAAVGLAISLTWWLQLRSYRDLNRAKFSVITKMEKDLVAAPFTSEWDVLEKDPVKGWRGRYAELGLTERVVPWLFCVPYVALLASKVCA